MRSLTKDHGRKETVGEVHGTKRPADSVDPLLFKGKGARRLVEEHIAELRSRVWWE